MQLVAFHHSSILVKRYDFKGCGPAYYTKLMFYFSNGNAYIMDQWTSKSIELLSEERIGIHLLKDQRGHRVSNKNHSGIYEEFCNRVEILTNITNQNLNTNNQHLYISNLCDDIFLHIKKCEKCQTKLKNELYLSLNNNIHLSAQQSNSSSLGSKGEIKHSSSLILDNLQQIIDKNKDIIVLILISVFIILILNLLNNLI